MLNLRPLRQLEATYEVLGSILGPDNRQKGSIDVGVEADIGGAVGASQAELGDEGDVGQHLGVVGSVRSGLDLGVLALRS